MTTINPADHLGIAKCVVERHISRCPRHARLREDLFAAACQGLVEAAASYDPSIAAWSTYAWPWCHGRMMCEIHSLVGAVTTPRVGRNHWGNDPLTAWLDKPITRKKSHHHETDRETTLLDLLPSADPGPEAAAAEAEERAHALALLAALPERSRRVLERRFGIGDDRDETLQEIGEDIGMSRQGVQQLEARALRALREAA